MTGETDGTVSDVSFSNKMLRQLLRKILPSHTEFDAFCLDEFPELFARFSPEMERLRKENMLLEFVSGEQVALVSALHRSNNRIDSNLDVSPRYGIRHQTHMGDKLKNDGKSRNVGRCTLRIILNVLTIFFIAKEIVNTVVSSLSSSGLSLIYLTIVFLMNGSETHTLLKNESLQTHNNDSRTKPSLTTSSVDCEGPHVFPKPNANVTTQSSAQKQPDAKLPHGGHVSSRIPNILIKAQTLPQKPMSADSTKPMIAIEAQQFEMANQTVVLHEIPNSIQNLDDARLSMDAKGKNGQEGSSSTSEVFADVADRLTVNKSICLSRIDVSRGPSGTPSKESLRNLARRIFSQRTEFEMSKCSANDGLLRINVKLTSRKIEVFHPCYYNNELESNEISQDRSITCRDHSRYMLQCAVDAIIDCKFGRTSIASIPGEETTMEWDDAPKSTKKDDAYLNICNIALDATAKEIRKLTCERHQ